MGVMTCNRHGCDNIMCDRGSHIYGYICYNCFEELIESGPETNIKTFMESDKKSPVNTDAARARYNVEFPYRNG